MFEDATEVKVAMDVPGIAKEDLSVSVEEAYLPSCVVGVEGYRRPHHQHQQQEEELQQDGPPSLQQQFRLGSQVECGELAATLSRGVLHLTVPKKQQRTPANESSRREIPIAEL